MRVKTKVRQSKTMDGDNIVKHISWKVVRILHMKEGSKTVETLILHTILTTSIKDTLYHITNERKVK